MRSLLDFVDEVLVEAVAVGLVAVVLAVGVLGLLADGRPEGVEGAVVVVGLEGDVEVLVRLEGGAAPREVLAHVVRVGGLEFEHEEFSVSGFKFKV